MSQSISFVLADSSYALYEESENYKMKNSCPHRDSNLIYLTLKGHRHDWSQGLFIKIILHKILLEFLQKDIQKCTNHFGKD